MSNKNREYIDRNAKIQKKDAQDKKRIADRINANYNRNHNIIRFPWFEKISMKHPDEAA